MLNAVYTEALQFAVRAKLWTFGFCRFGQSSLSEWKRIKMKSETMDNGSEAGLAALSIAG